MRGEPGLRRDESRLLFFEAGPQIVFTDLDLAADLGCVQFDVVDQHLLFGEVTGRVGFVPGHDGVFVDRRFRICLGRHHDGAEGTLLVLQAGVFGDFPFRRDRAGGDGGRELVEHHGKANVLLELLRRHSLGSQALLVDIHVELAIDLEGAVAANLFRQALVANGQARVNGHLREQLLVDQLVQELAAHDGLVERFGIEGAAKLRLHPPAVVLKSLVVFIDGDFLVVDHRNGVVSVGGEVGTHSHESERNDQDTEDEDGNNAIQTVAN